MTGSSERGAAKSSVLYGDRLEGGRNRWPARLWVILVVSLALKLGVWAMVLRTEPSRFLAQDSPGYHNSARALLQTRTFAVSPETPSVHQVYRTPGYPAFLAGVYTVFGEHPPAAIVVQIVISIVTIALTFWIANSLWGPQVALLAALLLGLDVTSFSFSLMLLTETLFAFWVAAMLAAGIRLLTATRKAKWALLLGFFLAMATLVRPIAYYLAFPLALGFLLFGWISRWEWKATLGVAALIVLPFVLVVGGWQVRNYRVTWSAEYNIAMHWTERRLERIREHPISSLRPFVIGTVKTMGGPGEGMLLSLVGYRGTSPSHDLAELPAGEYLRKWFTRPDIAFLAFPLAMLYLIVVYTGILTSVWRGVKAKNVRSVHLFMWGVLLYFALGSANFGMYVNYRFRIPIMPILAVYAAWGITQVWRTRARRQGGIELSGPSLP